MIKAKKSKRFRYNLATVLKVREIREKQAQEAFNEAEKALAEEERKEKEIKEFQAGKYLELREMMQSGKIGDMQEIMLRKAHLERLKEQVARQVEAREKAEKVVEEKREDLIKAVKEKKIMEKDKEKKREAWRKLMDKEEGKFLDDISGVGFERKRRGETAF